MFINNMISRNLINTSNLRVAYKRKTVGGGTVDTQIGRKIPISVSQFCHKMSKNGHKTGTISKLWDFEGRKVFGTKGAFSGRENRCAEGGTRTHTEFPPHAPQALVPRPETAYFGTIFGTILLFFQSFNQQLSWLS